MCPVFWVILYFKSTFQIDCIIIWIFHTERRIRWLCSSLVMPAIAWLPWYKKLFDKLQQLNEKLCFYDILEMSFFCMVRLFAVKCSGVNFVFCKSVYHTSVCLFYLLEWPGSSGVFSGQRRIHMSSL